MKFSRKVGRRSRSSVSRRRLRSKKTKNSYRKKNAKTQKGGKQGQGQKRMRARTHKRGKRFHRGGFSCIFTENNGNYELTIQSNSLYVKKNGELFQGAPTQVFNVKLSVKTGRNLIQDMSNSSETPILFEVTFERTTPSKKDNKVVSFNISDLSYFTEKNKQKTTKRVENNSETYDFSDIKNNDFFKEIKTCIETQLQIQKKELEAYYEENKDLLKNCRIIILSSMVFLMYPRLVDIKPFKSLKDLFDVYTLDERKPKVPYFSFFVLVYYDNTTATINIEKTKKLLELFTSLYKYGIFSFGCTGNPIDSENTSFHQLKQVKDSIKLQIEQLMGNKSLTTSSISSSISPLLPSKSYKCPIGSITDAGILFVLTSIEETSESVAKFLDYDGVPQQLLTSYLKDQNPDSRTFDVEEYRSTLPQSKRLEDTPEFKIQKRKSEVDGVIASLGENIIAHPNDTTSKIKSYSEFKQEPESQATRLKEQINSLTEINDDEKEIRKANVDFYLKKILETQLDYMRRRYRAFYIYQDFPKSDTHRDRFTNAGSGLYETDETYTPMSVFETSNMLENNVKAFQFRMEKQAENLVDAVYSDLVSTRADDSNYEKLFSECQGPGIDVQSNATACYKSLEYKYSQTR